MCWLHAILLRGLVTVSLRASGPILLRASATILVRASAAVLPRARLFAQLMSHSISHQVLEEGTIIIGLHLSDGGSER